MAEHIKCFEGVLLASDYDGTLACSDGTIPESVRSALRFFMENGGRFTVSTGRVHRGFHAYSAEIINAPVLLGNGSMAYDYAAERIVFSNGIGDEGIAPMRAIARTFPQLCMELYPFERSYVIHLTDQSYRHFTAQGIPFEEIDDPADAPRPWIKAMLGGPREIVAQAQEYIRANCPEISFLPTCGSYLEVLKKGVDKGVGLLQLADALGIAHDDVYAVGDGYNDVEMLRAAAKAFVPANGDPLALDCADHVVRSNEEGAVAHVIEILTEIYKGRSVR